MDSPLSSAIGESCNSSSSVTTVTSRFLRATSSALGGRPRRVEAGECDRFAGIWARLKVALSYHVTVQAFASKLSQTGWDGNIRNSPDTRIAEDTMGQMAGLSQAEFRDIDEFNEAVQGWDIDFQQVERGGLDAGLTSYPSRLTNLLRVHFSRAIAQSGSSPPGMRTFGLREDTSPWFEWCGREVKADSLLCFHPNSDFECLSRGGFAAFAMSFPETQLVAIAERLGHPDLFDQLCTEEAIDATVSVHLPRLHALLRQAFLDPDASLRNTKPIRSLDLFENSVAEELIMLLVDARCEPSRVSLRSRSRAVKAAMSFILQNAGERLTVSQVCEASGTSWRTLDRAFKEKLGTTPKACINKARLQGARRDLKGAAPTASVADIANKWGFWHLGDFAMNYRREFDELPSETLGKQGREGCLSRKRHQLGG